LAEFSREREADLLRERKCRRELAAAQDGGKFLTAEPREIVAGPEIGLGLFRENLQHHVAHAVAVAVVDLLETVEIEQDRDQRTRVFRALLQPPQRLVEKSTAVRDAGERVDQRCELLF